MTTCESCFYAEATTTVARPMGHILFEKKPQMDVCVFCASLPLNLRYHTSFGVGSQDHYKMILLLRALYFCTIAILKAIKEGK